MVTVLLAVGLITVFVVGLTATIWLITSLRYTAPERRTRGPREPREFNGPGGAERPRASSSWDEGW